MMSLFENRRIPHVLFSLLILVSVALVQGCFHKNDSSPAPIPDQDASGIYNGTDAELGGTGYNDLKGIIYNNKLMVFSVSAHVLYEGTVTTISGDNFTASVNVYVDGILDLQSPVEMTGKVMSASYFNVTFTGTGMASGYFDLTYDSIYETAAIFDRIDTDTNGEFTGILYGSQDLESDFVFKPPSTKLFGFVNNGLYTCGTGSVPVTYSSQINIYTLSDSFNIAGTCEYDGTMGFTGIAALVDGDGTDDKLWIAFTNGSSAFFSVATR